MDNDNQKIFIVEDNSFYSEIIKEILEMDNHSDIEIFESGKSCIDNLFKQPDIVILDFHLGDMNGLDVLKEIKSQNSNCEVIALTGQEDIKNAVELLKYGALDYLEKNSDSLLKLSDLIKRIISLKEKPKRAKSIFKNILGKSGLFFTI